jgi:hypothetical protein
VPAQAAPAARPKPTAPVQAYNITIATAADAGAATTAKVYAALRGTLGETGARLLCDDPDRIVAVGCRIVAIIVFRRVVATMPDCRVMSPSLRSKVLALVW